MLPQEQLQKELDEWGYPVSDQDAVVVILSQSFVLNYLKLLMSRWHVGCR